MSDLTLQPVTRPFSARVTPPGSKSLTNRALVLAALADGISELSNILFADDTLVMLDSLQRLGFRIDIHREDCLVHVHGAGGRVPAGSAELFCGNSGTTIRFLAALCSLGRGNYQLDGIARMRQRPIGQLVDLLRNLGVRIDYGMEQGYPPIVVRAAGLPGGIGRFGEAQSSQYLSAVLHICPYARHEVQIELDGRQTSWPYVLMTMRLMDEFGVLTELYRDPVTDEPRRIIVPRGKYRPAVYAVEPDASNAGYFLAAAALHPGSEVTIPGLGRRSLQGDVGLADVLQRMGAQVEVSADHVRVRGSERLRGIDIDLNGMPDMAQTLAVVALFAEGESRLRGLHTLRVKETDRLGALATELAKFGAAVRIEADALLVQPPGQVSPAVVDTYDDHRMAMSFALAGTRVAGVTLRDVECVNKTYPRFFEDLRQAVGV